MDERIKEAFEQVQAESGLKDRTKAYVSRKTGSYRRAGTAKYKVLASAFACVALLLFGGYWLYFTPTVEISIDVNPSIELGVNRFARTEEVQAAHETGLSYGKYRAYLELQELDPTVTVEQIQTMTMREIRERIWELSGDGDSETQPSGNGHGQQGNGNGQGQQNRWGRTNIP